MMLYIFTCQHGKRCNFLSDCKECVNLELARLRKIIKIAKNNIERIELIAEDEPDSLLKQEIQTAYLYLQENNTVKD